MEPLIPNALPVDRQQETCKHEPNWKGAKLELDSGYLFVDVPCKLCGLSGTAGSFDTRVESIISWD
jgi:hypothetical protein